MLPVFIFFIVERGELKACYLAVLLFAVLLLPTKTVGERMEGNLILQAATAFEFLRRSLVLTLLYPERHQPLGKEKALALQQKSADTPTDHPRSTLAANQRHPLSISIIPLLLGSSSNCRQPPSPSSVSRNLHLSISSSIEFFVHSLQQYETTEGE